MLARRMSDWRPVSPLPLSPTDRRASADHAVLRTRSKAGEAEFIRRTS